MVAAGVHVEPDSEPEAAPVAVRPWSTYEKAAGVLVLVTLLWRGWTTARWSWTADDWLYLADTRSMSLWHYLVQDYNGHVMPGEFLVSWITTKAAPLDYRVPVALVAIAAALNTWLWSRALAALGGQRLVLLVPLSVLALSPLMIRPTIWWASALQVLPLQIALALVVTAASRWDRTGGRREVAHLVLALLLGLFFWEKALLLVIPAAAVLLHRGSGSFGARLRACAAPLTALGAVVVAYTPLYLWLTRTPAGEREMGVRLGAERDLGSSVDFFVHGLGDLLAPALLGGPWHTLPVEGDPYAQPPVAVVLASVAIVVLGTGWALLRVPRAWIPVAMALGYCLVSCGLVLSSNRFDLLGQVSINDERYLADPLVVCALAAAMVLAGRPPRTEGPRARLVGRVLAVALAGSLVVGNATAAAKIGTRPSRPWVANVTTDLAQRRSVALLDTYAPPEVLQAAFFGEDARLSRMLSPLEQELRFGGPATRLMTVADDGHLREVTVGDAAHAQPGPVPGCGYGLDAGQSAVAPMSTTLYDWDWVVQVNTFTSAGGRLSVDIDGDTTSFDVAPGLTQTQFAHTGEVPGPVTLSLAESAGTVCVTDVIVGNPEAG